MSERRACKAIGFAAYGSYETTSPTTASITRNEDDRAGAAPVGYPYLLMLGVRSRREPQEAIPALWPRRN